jgi:hypothetical protein
MYWRYERFMKRRESSITSLIGVSGCCYAVRASLYEPVRKDLISDFVIAHMIYRKGKRVVYEPKALCYEEARRTTAGEFKMRVRVAVRTIHGMTGMGNLLNPFAHGFYAIQIISHKIFRYMVPLFLLACFISNMIIVMRPHIRIYDTIFVLQIAFYGCAAAGWLLRERRTLFYVPYYFCVTNAAILLGLIKFLKGERRIQWNTANTME